MKKFVYLIASIINAGVTALCLYLSPYVVLPMHYGISGYADRYASKWEIMIYTAIPAVIGIVYLVYSILTKKKDSKNKKLMDKIFFAMFVFILVNLWCLTIQALQCKNHMSNSTLSILAITMGTMFLVLSNFLPKARQNGLFGFRTFATLSSQTVWNKTHRLAGMLGVVGSLTLMLSGVMGAMFEKIAVYVFIAGIAVYLIVGIIIPCVYASVIYQKEKNN